MIRKWTVDNKSQKSQVVNRQVVLYIKKTNVSNSCPIVFYVTKKKRGEISSRKYMCNKKKCKKGAKLCNV